MNQEFLDLQIKRLLSRMNKRVFLDFINIHFASEEKSEARIPLWEGEEEVFYSPIIDSYGGSIHHISVLDYHLPQLQQFDKQIVAQNLPLRTKLQKLWKEKYRGQYGQWGMVSPYLKKDRKLGSMAILTNLQMGTTPEDHRLPVNWYSDLLDSLGIRTALHVGSFDSYFETNREKAIASLENLLNRPSGISIVNLAGELKLESFVDEAPEFFTFKNKLGSIDPVRMVGSNHNQELVREFEYLISGKPKELELEKFLKRHYQDLFGEEYDRVETQIWLPFPELEVFGMDRRPDLFLRNSIRNDWELVELKLPQEKVVKRSGTTPDISSKVNNGITQLKNYERLLQSKEVRKHLEQRGIEVHEPQLRLVIGRRPSMEVGEWHYLRKTVENRGLIFDTYDDLLNRLKVRFRDTRH